MALEIQFWSVNYTLVAKICKSKAKDKTIAVYIGFKVNKTFWITCHTEKHYFSTLSLVTLQLFIKNRWHGWRASCIWTVNFKWIQELEFYGIKGALPSLRKVLETESLLTMIKNDFHL